MSGGRYDFIQWKIEDFANSIEKTEKNPRRESFKQLLLLISQAVHDIDYVDSSDYAPGDENASIDAVFAFLKSDPEMVKKAGTYDELRNRILNYFNENK